MTRFSVARARQLARDFGYAAAAKTLGVSEHTIRRTLGRRRQTLTRTSRLNLGALVLHRFAQNYQTDFCPDGPSYPARHLPCPFPL